MAHYAIGDIQGCWQSLQHLLQRLQFDPNHDRLWLAGDLVNRGPQSLQVLRWARDLGDRAVVVLGNHDMHLIGCALGGRKAKQTDTFQDVLGAPDRDELIDWLRARPLLHRDGDVVMVHAGLHPSWSLGQAEHLAASASAQLRGSRASAGAFAGRLREIDKVRWRDEWRVDHSSDRAVEMATVVLVSIRTCKSDGELCEYSGAPERSPAPCRPWFERWRPPAESTRVVFGHWSALGLSVGKNHICLDTGCVWGRALTAVRLDDMAVFSQPSVDGVACGGEK